MCECITPSAFSAKIRKAIKKHRCCECDQNINAGETYQYCSGVWDGVPDSYKTCFSCLTLREIYTSETGECAAFEHLRESIGGEFCLGYGIKEFISDYQKYEHELKRLFKLEAAE